ncbi:Hypothetical protein SCF082_LOCUS16565 [Durusdinium trenchii]|uniref:DUF1995 domain-containing protein n=1 Tax=Durusdinium trenchii TaxID=1381693 RepID=A0ABP0KBW5_9DINO
MRFPVSLGLASRKRPGPSLIHGRGQKSVLNEVERGDRELARLYVEMLSQLGPGLVVAFRSSNLERAAKKRWRLTPEEARLWTSFVDSKKSAFSSEVEAPTQFRKKLQGLDPKCLVVVAPQVEQLRVVAELSQEVGDQMGLILLNARLFGQTRRVKTPAKLRSQLIQEFNPAYHLRFFQKSDWPKNSMIYREAGTFWNKVSKSGESPWIVAVQRQLVGGAVVSKEVLRPSMSIAPLPWAVGFLAGEVSEGRAWKCGELEGKPLG